MPYLIKQYITDKTLTNHVSDFLVPIMLPNTFFKPSDMAECPNLTRQIVRITKKFSQKSTKTIFHEHMDSFYLVNKLNKNSLQLKKR